MAKTAKLKCFVFLQHRANKGKKKQRWDSAVAEAETDSELLAKIKSWLDEKARACERPLCEHVKLLQKTPTPAVIRLGLTKNIKKI